jgi:hypothetical protein
MNVVAPPLSGIATQAKMPVPTAFGLVASIPMFEM